MRWKILNDTKIKSSRYYVFNDNLIHKSANPAHR